MKQSKAFSIKRIFIALAFSSLLMSGAAQAYYEDDYYESDDYYDDAYLALIPLLLYSALSEPRVVVHKKIYRKGYLNPRYTRQPRHHQKHRKSRSRDHYKYPQRGRHHGHF